MGSAILQGMLASGKWGSADVEALVATESSAVSLREKYGITVHTSLPSQPGAYDIVVLAVKPGLIKSVLQPWHGKFGERLLISVATGVTIEGLQVTLGDPKAAVIRAMPNTPAQIGRGITVRAAAPGIDPTRLAAADAILEACGTVLPLEESLIDAATAISGSGPAYFFLVIEALADAGVRLGLPTAVALQLATETAAGSAELLIQSGEHPAILRSKVTSPGGTTIAAIHALESHGLRAAFFEAAAAAARRAAELRS